MFCVFQSEDRGIHNVRVPQRGEDGGHDGLAYFTSNRIGILASILHDFWERFELFDFDNIVQIRSGIREMWAKRTTDFVPCSLHFGIEHGLNERHTTATYGSRFGLGLDFPDRLATILLDATSDHSLCDIVAGTDLCIAVEVGGIVLALLLGAEHELRWGYLEWFSVLYETDEFHGVAGIANHHSAEKIFVVGCENVFLVHDRERVFVL